MEDFKISQLTETGTVGLESILPIVNAGVPTTFKVTLATIKDAIQSDDLGSQVFFSYDTPTIELGRDNDVYFDLTTKRVHQKSSGIWVLKTTLETKHYQILFTATQNQVTYQSDFLKGVSVESFFVDGFLFHPSTYSLDIVTGVITFPSLNLNCQVVINYA